MSGMDFEAAAILDEIRKRLRAMASEERRASTMGFFREPVDPYGIPVPKVRTVVRDAGPRVSHPLPSLLLGCYASGGSPLHSKVAL